MTVSALLIITVAMIFILNRKFLNVAKFLDVVFKCTLYCQKVTITNMDNLNR